jgi:hypothetical protein
MIIETKFNIGDRIYYGDETVCYDGKIEDIKITFFGGKPILQYRVDTQFINEKDRYKDFDESRLYSTPNELLKMQIRRYELQIGHMKDRIEEIKKRINNEGKNT